MLLEEFTEKVFELFESGKKDEAKEIIIKVLNETVEEKTNEYDIKDIMKYALSNVEEKTNDEIETAAKDVFSKVRNTKDWNEIATLYLQKKGMSEMKIDKVIKVLDSLYS